MSACKLSIFEIGYVWKKQYVLCTKCSTMCSYSDIVTSGSSRPEVFCKEGILINFSKFTGKHLCQSLFLNKVAGLRPATLLKKRLWHRCFPMNFVKFLGTPFFIEHLW